ncbi:MAG TPA: HAMP domain-containing sensor histidine kinase [Streptosporangiaceae bacterium]|nr:HAMP domain-containing sensor histidine kinase [Streptosporangiaceae bacterium]
MTTTSGPRRWQENLRRLPGRTPLRVKMITALLALVIIALAIISVATLSVFSNYLQGQSATQVTTLYNQRISLLNRSADAGPGGGGLNSYEFGYYGAFLVELLDTNGQAISPFGPMGQSGQVLPGPDVPTSAAWLRANSGTLATVGGTAGSGDWQVITKEMTVGLQNDATGQAIGQQRVVLVVAGSLANIDNTVAWLAKIDLLVSAIIVVALAIVGVAIVRASLRPLRDIERTAQAIAAGDLSRRVPDQDPVTEVGRLGRSLNTMLSQIESSFDAQAQSEAAARRSEERMRQFVADASHELRTPLTAMRGYAEYYRQRGGLHEDAPGNGQPSTGQPSTGQPGTGQPSDELGSSAQLTRGDMDRIMQRVEQESARMGVLVEDMLLLARLDQQRPIEHRPVDLLTLAADAVQDARIIAPDREITLDVGSGAAFLILGDEVRLRQVIGNLMNNALTHTPDGTPVAVRVLAGPRQPVPSVVLEVADQGPGLRRDQAEHVFERFYRADQARTRRAGGTGLGLAIVAALVAAHDGTVALQTAPGQGATFRITLPLAPEAQDDQPDESDQPAQESPAEAATTSGEWPGPGA